MDHSPDQSKQNRGHQTGSTQSGQMFKLQKKVHQLFCEATAREKETESQLQAQLQEFQQRIQVLENNEAVKDLKIANLTTDTETLKVTLDEKQKRIGDLEGSLNVKTKKVVELEKSLLKAGRTLQGFVTDLHKKEKELEQLKIEALKRQKMDGPLIAPVKKLDKRNINENENPTPDVHKLSNGVAQVLSAGAGPPRDSFVIVGKKNVHFNEARVAKFYVQSVSIEAHNSSKNIIELDIFIADSNEFGMLDERGSSVSRLLLKVESGKKIYLQVSFSPRCMGNFNTQLVITPRGQPASNLRYPVSLSGEAFR